MPPTPLADPIVWGRAVRRTREKRGLSQDELAFRAGTDQANLSRIELGKQRPSDALKLRLAQELGVAVNKLFPLEAA